MIDKLYKVNSVNEALEILDNSKVKPTIIAGGTDLIIKLREGKNTINALIDISYVEEIKGVILIGNKIRIGAATTFNNLINSEVLNINLSGLKKAASMVGSPQIRNRATIGGNICNASPSADIIPPLLALEAKVVLESKNNKRVLNLEDFILDKNKVDLNNNEILTYIEFNNLSENKHLRFYKLSHRKALAIAQLSSSVCVEVENNKFKDVQISLGAVDKIPFREYEIENYLLNKEVDENIVVDALEILSNKTIDRLANRSSGEFKSEAIKWVLKKALEEVISVENKSKY